MDSVIPDLTRVQRLNSIDLQCDSTGLFYWVAERKFSDVCLTMKAMIQCQFKNHIIVCITKQPKGIKLGLASFVLPLRSTSIPIKEVKPIIIVCESKVIEKEWRSLKNFPGIYVLSGSPLYRANLRAAGVETCSTCVVLSCLHDTSGRPSLMIDKESILCTLNIRQLLAEANKTNNTERNQPMLVSELYDLHNASLLSTASKNGSTYFSPLIASGNIVESDVLHSLSSNVLFDPTVITFIETILGGGPGHEVEKVFAIDSGFFPGLRGQPISTLMFPDYLTGNIPYEVNNARHTNNQVYSKDTQNTVTTTIGSDFDSVTTEQFKIFFKDNNLLKKLFQFDPELKSHELNDNCMESSRSTTGEIFSDTDNTKEKISTDNEQINFKSFLSYKTETGDEVTVRLSQLLLVPLEELNSDLYQLASQRVLTFNELFHTVLVNTGTITVGLYRRVEDSKNTREDISYENAHEVSASIERFVYTLPEPKTIIYPNDMVYCLTAMTENPMTEQQIL
uniref:Uncharacterized protein n=1 Tax=Trichobilharzia regenti TaxID=157069 RepID=A0AA85K3T0_TRIRE|nr:unnamed protein product [Trichobilharzia regenti]